MNVPPNLENRPALVNFDDVDDVDEDEVGRSRPHLRDPRRHESASATVDRTVCGVLRWARSRSWTSRTEGNAYKALMALCRQALREHDDSFEMTIRELALAADISEHRQALTARDRLVELRTLAWWSREVEGQREVTQWQLLTLLGFEVCSYAPRSEGAYSSAGGTQESEDLDVRQGHRGASEHTHLRPAPWSPGAWREKEGMGKFGLLLHQAGYEGLLEAAGQDFSHVTVADCVRLLGVERSVAQRGLTRLLDRGFAEIRHEKPGQATVYAVRLGAVVHDSNELRVMNILDQAEAAYERQAEWHQREEIDYREQRELKFPRSAAKGGVERTLDRLMLDPATASEVQARLDVLGGRAAVVRGVLDNVGTREVLDSSPAFMRGGPKEPLARPQRRPPE